MFDPVRHRERCAIKKPFVHGDTNARRSTPELFQMPMLRIKSSIHRKIFEQDVVVWGFEKVYPTRKITAICCIRESCVLRNGMATKNQFHVV